ncbi:MAG: hypothetical protein HXL26_04265 [Porphyromonadaceae bacterium]|nr:hypothetical protein [Porphyromonadaceae bacterium]
MSLSPQPSPRGSRLSRWLTSPRGQLLLHRSYSWGAALVILGALFKILELPYADGLLLVSMLTECLIFILSGFDSPEQAEATSSKAGASEPSFASAQLKESLEALGKSIEQLSQHLASSPSLSTRPYRSQELDSSLSPAGYQKELKQLTERVQQLRLVYETSLQGSSEFQRQNERLVAQLIQLNELYARMIHSLSVSAGIPKS